MYCKLQVRRRASLGDVMDIMQSPYVPRSRSYDSVVFDFRDVAADDFAVRISHFTFLASRLVIHGIG